MKSYEKAALDILFGKRVEEDVEQIVEYGAGRADPKKTDRDEAEKQMADFLARGGKIQQGKPPKEKRSGRMIARGSLSAKERRINPQGGKSFVRSEETDLEEAMTHPMAVHVKEVPGKRVGGLPAYQVHKVGSQVKRIKVGEHLNDTHLDDLADMGHKIRMKEDVDYTIIAHNSFEVYLPEQLTYNDYLNAAKLFEDSEVVKIADECFQEQDESIVVASESIETLREEIQSFVDEGHEVSLPKYTGETDNPGVEFIVTDKESGVVTKYVHHGIVKRS